MISFYFLSLLKIWKSIVYVTDLHALLTSCGCTDKILHFQPLSQMLRTGSPFWSGDDRSMTSVDPAIFNPRRGGGGGREGGGRESDARDRWHPRRPLSPRLIHPCCWSREWKGGRGSSARMRLAATRIRTKEKGGARDRFAILYDLSRLTILAGPWNEICFTLR